MHIAKRWMIIAILLGVFFLQSFSSLITKSATFDEVQYFGIGKYLLVNHKWDVMGSILHPPLSFYVSSLPLLFVSEDKKLWEYDETIRDLTFLGSLDFLRGQGFLTSIQNANDRLLIASRIMILLLGMVLGYYVYRFSSELYGEKSGILSLVVFVFCPNMIAYSGIAVPDMPLTVFLFVFMYYLWRFLKQQNSATALSAGLTLGLALSTKFTALILLPILLILYLIFLYKEKQKPTRHILLLAGSAFVVFFALYCFDLTPFYQGNEHRMMQMKNGQAAFFHNAHSNFGWWYFYPATFLLKTPLSVLALLCASLAFRLKYRSSGWFDTIFLLLPIAVFFAVFCMSNFSVGIRYILPIYPFIFVIVGGLAVGSAKNVRYFVLAMVFWLIGSSWFTAPHYLAYFNEIIGGPTNGYKYLVDSNLDWGQDLKGLKRYMDAHDIKRISLSYFGADSPQRYGIEYDWLPSHHLYNPEPEKPVNLLANRFLAISATNLQGVYFANRDEFKWLRDYQPVAKVGYSIFVYDLSRIVQ